MKLADKPQFVLLSEIKSAFHTWRHIGASNHSKRQTQRIVLTNVMISVISALSYINAIMLALYDFDQFRWPITILLFVGTAILATPFLNKRHPYLGSAFNLTLWVGGESYLTYIFGVESGVYFYFLAGAASAILIMGVYQNALSFFSFFLQIGLFIYFEHSSIPPASFLNLDPVFLEALHLSSIILTMMFIFYLVYYAFYQAHLAEDALEREYEYSEKLLANMLPASIATELKRHPGRTIADNHDNVTILFADIVGFIPRAEQQNATELVRLLNNLFTRFDLLVQKHGLEKIKTIGDAFMVAGGLPDPQPDHAERMARMALDMMEETHKYGSEIGDHLELRIGMHHGPVVAGIIGTQKPVYDVWGDTVNVASRLESSGIDGKIQVADCTRLLLGESFSFEKRGKVMIKGKGNLDVWYLTGIR